MRDFFISHKDQINFVYNFHCAGMQFIIPLNGVMPNNLAQKHPEIKKIFQELVEEAQFAPGTDIGPASELLGFKAGGSAGDWIVSELGIPAAEAEIGAWDSYGTDWVPLSVDHAMAVVNENLPWVEYTYNKIGNQIKIEPLGYTKMKLDPTESSHLLASKYKAILKLRVTNHGLSDQVHDNIKIRVENKNLHISTHDQSLYQVYKTPSAADIKKSKEESKLEKKMVDNSKYEAKRKER